MIFIISIMTVIAALQVPSLISRKQWGELAAFIVFWLGGGIYASLVALQVPVPNPTRIVIDIITTYLPLPGFLLPP